MKLEGVLVHRRNGTVGGVRTVLGLGHGSFSNAVLGNVQRTVKTLRGVDCVEYLRSGLFLLVQRWWRDTWTAEMYWTKIGKERVMEF